MTTTINGWKIQDGQAVWMQQTPVDPQGNAHTMMLIARREESPNGLLEQAKALSEQGQTRVDDPQRGMYLRFLYDGAPQGIFELGGGYDLPLDEFVLMDHPMVMAEAILELLVKKQARTP